jgi:putative oxidoreductase
MCNCAPAEVLMVVRYGEISYALLRMVAGLLFASHGAQKLFGMFGAQPATDQPLMLIGGILELVLGLAVAIGLFARPAGFIASGEMAVAYFMAHAPKAFWPVQNKGETAVLYCFYFLLVSMFGAGIWSLDAVRKRGASGATVSSVAPTVRQIRESDDSDAMPDASTG